MSQYQEYEHKNNCGCTYCILHRQQKAIFHKQYLDQNVQGIEQRDLARHISTPISTDEILDLHLKFDQEVKKLKSWLHRDNA